MKQTINASQALHSLSRRSLALTLHGLPKLRSPLSPTLTTIQFKNAVYYGPVKANMSQGIGITIYDDADVLIGCYDGGQLCGQFVYYSYGYGHRGEDGRGHAGELCYYGSMYNGKLDGECYIYDRNTCRVQTVLFDMGFRDPRGQNTHHSLAQNGRAKTFSNSLNSQIGIHKNSNEASNQSLAKPTVFLSQHLCPKDSSCLQEPQLRLCQISSTHLYFGTLKHNKPHGYGIIFIDEWPVCYGSFADGDMSGLGRVEQNRGMVLDGVFELSTMKQGWVLDFRDNMTSYGQMANQMSGTSAEEDNSEQGQRFQLIEEYAGICPQKIWRYRRMHHLRSLNYANEYCLSPLSKMMLHFPHMQQPSQYQHKLAQHMQTAVQKERQNFDPPFITFISRVNGSPDPHKHSRDMSSYPEKDLLDLIKEHSLSKANRTRNSSMLYKMMESGSETNKNSLSKSKSRSKKQKGRKSRSRSRSRSIILRNQSKLSRTNAQELETGIGTNRGKSGSPNRGIQGAQVRKINGHISNIFKLSSHPYLTAKTKSTPM